jgi:hypothetical protein
VAVIMPDRGRRRRSAVVQNIRSPGRMSHEQTTHIDLYRLTVHATVVVVRSAVMIGKTTDLVNLSRQ